MKLRLLVLLLLFPLFTDAQWSKEHPILITYDSLKTNAWICAEKWLFTQKDDSLFAQKNVDDAGWQPVDPALTNNGKTFYNGVSWFRYYFSVDSSMIRKPITISMMHNGASEIYLDGILIKKVGKIKGKDNSEYATSKYVPYILTLEDTGLHVFAVRYANYHAKQHYKLYNAENAGFSLVLDDANNQIVRQSETGEIITFLTMFIAGIFIALAVVHFLIFLFYHKARYNLYFSLFNLSIALISYFAHQKMRAEDPIGQLRSATLSFFAFWLFVFSITAFINELLAKRKLRFRIFTAILLAILVVRFFYYPAAYIALVIFFAVVIVETLVVIIIAIAEKVKGARIVGFGFLFLISYIFIIFFAAIINGGTFNLGETAGGVFMYIFIIALVSIPLSISAYLAWQFAAVNKDLTKQLDQVKLLSEKTIRQEKEKKHLLETQNERLEKEVAERTEEIRLEKKKSDDLLLNILPSEIAEELKLKGESKAHKFDEVSVLFTDFVNFTQISEQLGVDELLNELNINFTAFDRIMEKHGLEKIKTIGDAYLAVCGLPAENSRHAQNTVNAALDILEFVKKRKEEIPYGLDIRIGINSGSLIAGIIGVKKFAYDIWGDTVNTAARMEQSSVAGKINISANTFHLVKEEFDCVYRGKVDAKNKGEMDMYFVTGRKA